MTGKTKLKQFYLVVVAIVALLAAVLQLVLGVRFDMAAGRGPLFGVIQTLSYFTVLTNLLVASVATVSARRPHGDTFLTRPSTLSAVAVYIFVVGLVYSLALRALWEPTGLQAVVDGALHDVVPVLYCVFWMAFVPKGTLRWMHPARWLIYPLLYFVYSLARGAVTAHYLYPFADASRLGYPTALLHTMVVVAGFWMVGLIVVGIDQALARRGGLEASRSQPDLPMG